MKRKEVEDNIILVALTGSIAYGLNVATSDIDYRGIFIAPKDYQLGLHTIEQKDSGWLVELGNGCYPYLTNKDTCCFELKKYLKLALNCNPNILEILFCNKHKHLNEAGQTLVDNKHLFLSKKAKHSYAGYAQSELRKMQNPNSTKYNASVGYNTKKGMHVIRLLTMGIEILKHNTIIVNRKEAGDQDYLLSIRNGEVPLKDLLSKAEDLQDILNKEYTSSSIQSKPNYEKVNRLCISLIHNHIEK